MPKTPFQREKGRFGLRRNILLWRKILLDSHGGDRLSGFLAAHLCNKCSLLGKNDAELSCHERVKPLQPPPFKN